MNPNFTFDAEGVFDQPIKPLRFKTRRANKQHWREKLTSSKEKILGPQPPTSQMSYVLATMKRFDLAYPEVPLSPAYYRQVFMAEQRGEHIPAPGVSVQRLKWRGPKKEPLNRRIKQRRTKDCDEYLECGGPGERRVLDRRSRSQPKKRKARPRAGWDGLNHKGILPVQEFQRKS